MTTFLHHVQVSSPEIHVGVEEPFSPARKAQAEAL